MTSDPLLLVAIHDVGPRFAEESIALAEAIECHLGCARFAMLVVPDHWGGAPLSRDPAFQRRLRDWSDQGIEMFVHGWKHLDQTPHRRWLDRWRASSMTAGEGEFLGLDEAEATRRIIAGKSVIEDATGTGVAGFVAPAWLYGEGARAALASSGMPLAEDHWRVWRPADGHVLARSPVVTWATRSSMREASSLAAAAVLRRAPNLSRVMRVAVHPGDLSSNAVMSSIAATISALKSDRRVGSYGDLQTP